MADLSLLLDVFVGEILIIKITV